MADALDLSEPVEMLGKMITQATAAGWWTGCVAACLRYSNHPEDRCEIICHQMLGRDLREKASPEEITAIEEWWDEQSTGSGAGDSGGAGRGDAESGGL